MSKLTKSDKWERDLTEITDSCARDIISFIELDDELKQFIHNLLKQQKEEIIKEATELQKKCADADGTIDGITALHELITHLTHKQK